MVITFERTGKKKPAPDPYRGYREKRFEEELQKLMVEQKAFKLLSPEQVGELTGAYAGETVEVKWGVALHRSDGAPLTNAIHYFSTPQAAAIDFLQSCRKNDTIWSMDEFKVDRASCIYYRFWWLDTRFGDRTICRADIVGTLASKEKKDEQG